MNRNLFWEITADTMVNSIRIAEAYGKIHHNSFTNVEMGANLLVTGNCENNTFSLIVARQNPLSRGNQITLLLY